MGRRGSAGGEAAVCADSAPPGVCVVTACGASDFSEAAEDGGGGGSSRAMGCALARVELGL